MNATKDISTVIDGVKVTMCAYRKPRKSEKTFDIDKSRYTAWTVGVSKYKNGSTGVQGTIRDAKE